MIRKLFLLTFSAYIFSCQQKQVIFQISSLKPQELRIYYQMEGFPQLSKDSKGNYLVSFDSSNIVNTSTKFEEVKGYKNTFCFGIELNKCIHEDDEINQLGYSINLYSKFTSDTTGNRKHKSVFDQILIEKY